MIEDERIAAVAAHGFTPRQAAFLATVMLHAGVCVPRQYTAFAGIAFGHTTREFFARLTRQGFATAYPCWRGAGRIYHLHHKGLYRAIGEPDNRHRRPATVARAIERLMVLDAVLADRQTAWLATEREKVAYFVERRGLKPAELPKLVFRQRGDVTVRYFPRKLPIGLLHADQVAFLYLVTDGTGRDFRSFLDTHRSLLQRLHRWTLRLVFPAGLMAGKNAHTSLVSDLVAPPVRPAVVDEFRWYCHARRTLENESPAVNCVPDPTRYTAARRAFGAPRFYAAYRAWRERGESALTQLLSPRLHDTWTRGDARLEIHVLPHQYHHLAPAVGTA
ncbi:MAG: hypothetical protein GEU99_02215 [Luteitalea sp.]|nr:hypothetical protein [Luteitalea sp.]